ncbi:Cyclic nucleotide-binding protein (modular protein) [Hyella patelloides LEGE 07179]|uniref:Cyclic nucleotide-binding protein (Modular protein) n=1 Tax=Hyella patelloides LEGE 07179 TaxID=945734 RepID=A0A563VWQ5_9CYAN|nr:Crp/Fnr family transcriptional regulator [Hyella patelloides]VEP15683.1 Cyclic nucleotide-binding protein (modular protein) [Hyella patelloides LEGE 07179]
MDLTDPVRLPEPLRNNTTTQNLAAGETLFTQEDEASTFYVVTSGRIKLVRYTSGGQVSTFEIVRASQSLAEIALFADTYPCTAISEIDSEVIAYPKEELLSVLRAYPDLAEDFMEMLVKKIQSLKFRLELRDIRIAHERVLHYLRHLISFPEETTIVLDRPLKDIAGDLGFTPETISRALIRLETDGEIARQENIITLQR